MIFCFNVTTPDEVCTRLLRQYLRFCACNASYSAANAIVFRANSIHTRGYFGATGAATAQATELQQSMQQSTQQSMQ
jgi:hypothetical protein